MNRLIIYLGNKCTKKLLSCVLLSLFAITMPFFFISCNNNLQNHEINEDDVNLDNHQKVNEDASNNTSKKNRVDTLIDSMTLEQKAGQMLILAFRRNAQGGNLLILDEYTSNVVNDIQPGGIILFSQNIKDIDQTSELINAFQNQSNIPLFIAIDEEGGIVDRLRDGGIKENGFPNSIEVGAKNDSELAYNLGVVIAKEISSLGFNMNFAPVADVNTNPDNPVIGKRSFGSDQELVATMVKAEVEGMQSVNVSAVIKHFPGHGDTSTDTHTGEVVIEHDIKRLEEIEYVPFKAGIEAGVDAIMTAHIKTPSISDNEYPATLNKDIITGQLRNKLGYKGLIITDGMEMGAITKYYSTEEAVILAIEAGIDIILIPEDAYEAQQAIIEAVNEGRISEERIDESLRRILETKLFRGILDNKTSNIDPYKVIDCEEHVNLIKNIK